MVWTTLIAHVAAFDPALLNLAFVFLMLGYGTKVGLAPLHAWLPDAHAEGPDADLGGAIGAAAQCGALCGAALQVAARRQSARHRARAADGDARPRLAGLRRLHAVPPPRHQTLFAYSSIEHMGDHRLRLRHGRPARQFRRALAHDDAQPDQIGDLLHRRPYRAGQGHAADRRHPRPHRHPSAAGLEPRRRRLRDRRPAANGRLHERVPGRHLDLRARALAGAAAGRSACSSHSAP